MRILTDRKLNELLKQARREAFHHGYNLCLQVKHLQEKEQSLVLREIDKILRGKQDE